MKKILLILLIALISSTLPGFAQGSEWGKDKWRIPTYKDDYRVLKLNNAFTGTDYCFSKTVGEYRVFNSFIYVHNGDCKYLELKLDCVLLSETTIYHKNNDRLALIKYNKPKDKNYAIVFSNFDKNKNLKQTVIIVEFNKDQAQPEIITVTNTIDQIVFVTNVVETASTSSDLNNINFKFHKGITYE